MDVQMIGWKGRCEVHEQFTVDDINKVHKHHPDAIVLAHPECSPEVTAMADFSGSTTAMINFVEQSNAPKFLLMTECSMADNIMAANPAKELVRMCSVRCPHMAQITLEETRDALKEIKHKIELPEDLRIRAKKSVERMLAL